MNTQRAQEILRSPKTIDVIYQDTSIWITEVDPNRNTAMVKMPEDSNNIVEVPVAELIERG